MKTALLSCLSVQPESSKTPLDSCTRNSANTCSFCLYERTSWMDHIRIRRVERPVGRRHDGYSRSVSQFALRCEHRNAETTTDSSFATLLHQQGQAPAGQSLVDWIAMRSARQSYVPNPSVAGRRATVVGQNQAVRSSENVFSSAKTCKRAVDRFWSIEAKSACHLGH